MDPYPKLSRRLCELLSSWAETTQRRSDKEAELAAAEWSHEEHVLVTDEGREFFNLENEAVKNRTDEFMRNYFVESKNRGADLGDLNAATQGLDERCKARDTLLDMLETCLDHAEEKQSLAKKKFLAAKERLQPEIEELKQKEIELERQVGEVKQAIEGLATRPLP